MPSLRVSVSVHTNDPYLRLIGSETFDDSGAVLQPLLRHVSLSTAKTAVVVPAIPAILAHLKEPLRSKALEFSDKFSFEFGQVQKWLAIGTSCRRSLMGKFTCDASAADDVKHTVELLNSTVSLAATKTIVYSKKEVSLRALTRAVWDGDEGDLLIALNDLFMTMPAAALMKLNKSRRTLLHIAAKRHHVDLVRRLLANGADVNARTNGGVTPIIAATFAGPYESKGGQHAKLLTIKALLSNGADALSIGGTLPRMKTGKCRSSAFNVAINAIAANSGDVSLPFLFIAAAGRAPPPSLVWNSVISRFKMHPIPDGALGLVGAGFISNPQHNQVVQPPALFSTLVELCGGPDRYYESFCPHVLPQWADFQFPPDCYLRELTEKEGAFSTDAVNAVTKAAHPVYATTTLNAAATRFGCVSVKYWSESRPYATAVSLQRPGMFELFV